MLETNPNLRLNKLRAYKPDISLKVKFYYYNNK